MVSTKEYRQAEARLQESVKLRTGGLRHHDYPDRQKDLETMCRHHAEHGVPKPPFWDWLKRRLVGEK